MGVYLPIKDYSAMQGPSPSGFHVPLNTEWQAVYDVWTALGGGSSDGTNFGIALKLPFAGYRDRLSAGVISQGTYGLYWSSSRYNANYAYNLYFNSAALNPQLYNYRANGFSVRCFKNSPVVPMSSWTKLYGTSIEAGGIFWSSADGLISLSSDGTTWITIADKNLGATTVWNSGDTLSEANCGKYYQRGNNYGFPRTGTIANQSTTQVDASNYGPGNYYSSDTFIKYSGRWDTTDNANLWGGVTGIKPMSELKNAYIGEYIVPTSGLLGYRPLQSDLKDLSGNGNNGTRYGTGAFDTVLGKTGARVTNTGDDLQTTVSHIETPLIYGSIPITFCFWADIYTQGSRSGIISNANASDNLTDFCLRTFRGNYNLVASLGNGNNNQISTYSLNTWVFYAITIDNSGAWKLYKDGTLSNSGTGANTATNSGYWWIGARNTGIGGSRGINGLMRHCAIYNRALTDAEILEFYNQTA